MQHSGHPDRLRALDVLAQVVDEDAVLRLEAEPLSGEPVDLRLRLVQADFGRDDDDVEELAYLLGLLMHHPGVGD